MEALITIALLCSVSGGAFSTIKRVDAHQLKCQKALIECYSSKFPKPPPSETEWVGALKTCNLERVVLD